MSSVDPEEVDALLSSELNSLSLQERGSIYEEIHGVDSEIEETPQLVAESLQLMGAALQLQVPALRDLYNQARQINPDYVDSHSFWLQFLRAEYFVAPKAALKLCRFLAGKVEYFGMDCLARPITLDDDFDPDDLEWLTSGITQLLPSRDRSGRIIIGDFNMSRDFPQPVKIDSLVSIRRDTRRVNAFHGIFPHDFLLGTMRIQIKTVIYLSCCIAEDVTNQKRGTVGIFYFNRHMHSVKRVLLRDPIMFDRLPVRFVAAHACSNDPKLRTVHALFMLAIGRDRRVRLRTHEGTWKDQEGLVAFPLSSRCLTLLLNCSSISQRISH